MPEHDVEDFEIRAVQFQHGDTRQAGQRTGHRAGGNRIHGEATPQHEPDSERRGNGNEQPRGEAGNALREEVDGLVVAEKDGKNGQER